MTLKIECNNPKCKTQVVANSPAMNGWLTLQQIIMFQAIGDQPAEGNFCTIACTIAYLESKQPRMEEIDGDSGGTTPEAPGDGG